MKYILATAWRSVQSATGLLLGLISQRLRKWGSRHPGGRTKGIRKSRTAKQGPAEHDDASLDEEEEELNILDQGFYEDTEGIQDGSCISQRILPNDINDSP